MDYICVGKLLGTHGLKGEIKFKTDFKYLDNILKKGFSFYLGSDRKEEILSSYRFHKNYYLLLFESINNINDVEKYINCDVYVLRSDLKLDSESYLMEDILDKEAYFKDKFLGVVKEIIDYGNSNYVMTISGDKDILVPLHDNFIEQLDDKLYLKNMEGFIDEN